MKKFLRKLHCFLFGHVERYFTDFVATDFSAKEPECVVCGKIIDKIK